MYRTVLWTLWERERVGRFGRMAMKHVKYHVGNELPVQVQCTMLNAWVLCTGMTQRDGLGREEGGGFRMEKKQKKEKKKKNKKKKKERANNARCKPDVRDWTVKWNKDRRNQARRQNR